MKRIIALFIALAMLTALLPAALADSDVEKLYDFYLIPDSDTRALTEEEIWGWEYDSLWYLIDEIFARHGFVFRTGGQMYNYFNAQAWYTPNSNPDNRTACYSQLSKVEWQNEHLIKTVKEQMEAQKTKNDKGTRSVSDFLKLNSEQLQGFTVMPAGKNAKWACYSAPSTQAWRGANGKALVNVGWPYAACGWENGWLLVSYETNKGSVRIGYVQPTFKVDIADELEFAYTDATVLEAATLTDDPMRTGTAMRKLKAGEQVTSLTPFYGYGKNKSWAYVETTIDGLQARGFVPADSLDIMVKDETADAEDYQ